MTTKIDHTYVHDQKCELFQYLRPFLKSNSPVDQIEVELKRNLENVAFHEYERLNKK